MSYSIGTIINIGGNMKEKVQIFLFVILIASGVVAFMAMFVFGFGEIKELRDRWGCENHTIVTGEQAYFAKYDDCYIIRDGRYRRL